MPKPTFTYHDTHGHFLCEADACVFKAFGIGSDQQMSNTPAKWQRMRSVDPVDGDWVCEEHADTPFQARNGRMKGRA